VRITSDLRSCWPSCGGSDGCNYEAQHHVPAALVQPRQRPGADALGEPFSACPSWFLRVECDRCGKEQMVNQARMRWDNTPIRDIIAVAG
jgi:hypothetical protein